jgi:hypothetical protein
MNASPNPPTDPTGKAPIPPPQKSYPQTLLKLPGLAAIAFYMVLLAGITIFDVASGRAHPIYIVFPVFFVAGALGLLLFLRWAWALTLAATALLSATFVFQYFAQHQIPYLMQGLLNLIFFLYLVRTDVREKLK